MQRTCNLVLRRGCGGGVNRKGLGRSFTTTDQVGDYKRKNAFEIWKCHSAETYTADLLFDESFKISEDKELLLRTRVSKYKNVKDANIKYLFLFLTFSQPCCNHFICKTNPSNGIPTQVLGKLNYLLLIKKILSYDSTQNRLLKFLYFNYVLPRRGRNKVSLDDQVMDDTYLGASPDGYLSPSGTKISQGDHVQRNSYDGNFRPGEYTNRVEPPQGAMNFCLKEIRYLFQRGKYEIVVHSNIKNKLLKHVYLDDLDDQINTQINYLNTFVNQLMDKSMLLQLYSFVESFFDQMEKHANEFLFFLDRLADKLLPKMNLVDTVFIFHMHIKLNYYNHLFLFMLIRKMELFFLPLLTYQEGNEELGNLYRRKIKYNHKSLVIFFHSLTNYFSYLNQLEGGTRYKDKRIHIRNFLYGKLGALHVLQILQRNYQSFSLLDYTLVFSTFNKLCIHNKVLSSVLLDYIDKMGSFHPKNGNSQKGRLSPLTTSLSDSNLHLYASLLSSFTKCFTSYKYCRDEYDKVMRVLLILFENALWVISKLFVSEGKNLLCLQGDHQMGEFKQPSGRTHLSVEKSHSRIVTSEVDAQIRCDNAPNGKSGPLEEAHSNSKPTYFAFIKLLQLERRKSKVDNIEEPPSEQTFHQNTVSRGEGDFLNRLIHQKNIETDNHYKTVYHVQNIQHNIKYIVNCLNSTYKLLNHFIEMFQVKEYSKKFNRILLYNFSNKLIFEKKNVNCSGSYLDNIHKCTVHGSRLFDYHEGGVDINRLFMCAYLESFLLCDLVNVYVGRMVKRFHDEMPQKTSEASNEGIFFSQVAANTLGAIQNLKMLRYDIFDKITHIIRRKYFKLDVVNVGNIIHSFASMKLRDVQIIELLTNQLISHANDKQGNHCQIGEQTLSNVSISLLRLDLPNEKFNEIIFRNYKKIQSVHALINITLYLCYYNFISSFVLQNNFTYLFERVNIADMSTLTVQNQTQLYLIALLTLYVHQYSVGEIHKWQDPKGIPFGEISTHLNDLRDVFLLPQRVTPTLNKQSGAPNADEIQEVMHVNEGRRERAFPESDCTHGIPSSINMFEILAQKRMNNSPMETNPLLSEKDYLNLHFIGAFPFSAPPVETTSSLHDEIYDLVASLSLPRRMTKELPHYPYCVDIVLA
ncbi:conserved Plasmodium protein, unknown function [Plasmodium knowlesi strain H]|uniref:Uncharacterized protein n=3 Tax=Plasmodium knowlesi TaxID=5850 RepID=A0A5K1VL51_PLAKH|nr:conserved Plasmodium protein, unknown function [Plasmodium knowlesi strain H]OTN64285.1 Uncharacterized protein PKNOH_S140283600 [Plasmodium knowlesi]CAA9991246.1 conserved Plasmodium protein, unknown function [Plasmodium knowlesi strain H]SBO26324.1 conserved Plasmodium protein, unknown function [Plasmodium knowlesi strain H]SBO29046.1 conserved Plasmodium protein, unknown function [Plasmodium knowlesi strain H]VVS80720.1 conserved Plasmodium protein, unknown function [Plasmodium knowlesi |eukprot:XP_002262525.1 hypothetical protein, conserved in Plasmodium species [Plasmodium knowlesi strain H]